MMRLTHLSRRTFAKFVRTYAFRDSYPDTNIKVTDNELTMLSCPLDSFNKNPYTGAQALIQQNTLILKYKGHYGLMLLTKNGKSYSQVVRSQPDQEEFDFANRIMPGEGSQYLPLNKSVTSRHPITGKQTLLVMSPGMEANLYSKDILKIMNQLSQKDVVDYQLYCKLWFRKFIDIMQFEQIRTPYSERAIMQGFQRFAGKRVENFACFCADVQL